VFSTLSFDAKRQAGMLRMSPFSVIWHDSTEESNLNYKALTLLPLCNQLITFKNQQNAFSKNILKIFRLENCLSVAFG